MLPLSGGADSSATAAIVGAMCQLVVRHVALGHTSVESDARRIGQYKEGESVGDARDLAGRLFATAYLGTVNSSAETRGRAAALAGQVGHGGGQRGAPFVGQAAGLRPGAGLRRWRGS